MKFHVQIESQEEKEDSENKENKDKKESSRTVVSDANKRNIPGVLLGHEQDKKNLR